MRSIKLFLGQSKRLLYVEKVSRFFECEGLKFNRFGTFIFLLHQTIIAQDCTNKIFYYFKLITKKNI